MPDAIALHVGPYRYPLTPGVGDGHLCVVLPGRGYGHDLPALRYPSLVLEEAGADVLRLTYPAVEENAGRVDGAVLTRVATDASAAVTAALASGGYRRVTLIGKSLGTVAMAALAASCDLPAGRTGAVWITPVFGTGPAREGAAASGWRSLFVVGLADAYHDAAAHAAVEEATGGRTLALERAGHDLEVPGDVRSTVAGLGRLVDAVARFVGDASAG